MNFQEWRQEIIESNIETRSPLETARLLIRPMNEGDENSFVNGIADRALRIAYGFPAEPDDAVSVKIFRHFCGLKTAFALTEKATGHIAGFLLDVDPELPDPVKTGLPEKGRTLAYTVFPSFQRQGYMLETLRMYIPYLFQTAGMGYIHCGHFTDNVPSRNLLVKLGFQEYARHTVKDRTIVDEILFP